MIIGLSGYARSGKDSVANILVDNFGFRRVGFADNVRALVRYINPLLSNGYRINEQVNEFGWEFVKGQAEGRRLLQATGMAVRDLFGKDTWINMVFADIEPHEDVVITDVRFQNEAEKIQEIGGYIWRVERTGIDAVNAHPSEHDMDDWDFDSYITNSGTLEDLAFSVRMNLRR
jgi:hypothetical protein